MRISIITLAAFVCLTSCKKDDARYDEGVTVDSTVAAPTPGYDSAPPTPAQYETAPQSDSLPVRARPPVVIPAPAPPPHTQATTERHPSGSLPSSPRSQALPPAPSPPPSTRPQASDSAQIHQ